MNKKRVKILVHILGCAVFLLIPVLFSPELNSSGSFLRIAPFKRDFLAYLLLVGFFYFNFFVLIPELYLNKKHLYFFLAAAACFIFILFFPRLLFPEGLHPPGPSHHAGVFQPQGPPPRPSPNHRRFVDYGIRLLQFLVILVFSLLLKISDRWKQVEKEKLSVELSYLKAQINPHFLFNTLNSIYSLAIQRSDETPAAVVKLSEMMRYVTTEAHSDFVSLEKELNYVSNYIELQKIRLGNTVTINYKSEGALRNKLITPLVLIPFVENAFKYGVNPEEVCYITISIVVNENVLLFNAANKKVKIDFSKSAESGYGINNASQRLAHSYPGKHKLKIEDGENEYTVSLTITLA
ncbi:histidine kinase [soil metagenome]